VKQSELKHYRERLMAMSARLRAEVADLDEAIANGGGDPADLTRLPTHEADRDSETLEVDETLERNQVALLNAVEAALARIETKTFGVCQGCGGSVAKERLDAIPYAALCIDCERTREKGAR